MRPTFFIIIPLFYLNIHSARNIFTIPRIGYTKLFWEFVMRKKLMPYFARTVIALAIPLGVGAISALLTRNSMDIYGELNTPPLSPPAILFPIVWSILYILMGISSLLVYNSRRDDPRTTRQGLTYYAASLVVNFSWSIIFFVAGSLVFAFVWLIFLLYLIIRTVICYKRISTLAACLQIPYILWVCFAGYLNLGIALMN